MYSYIEATPMYRQKLLLLVDNNGGRQILYKSRSGRELRKIYDSVRTILEAEGYYLIIKNKLILSDPLCEEITF